MRLIFLSVVLVLFITSLDGILGGTSERDSYQTSSSRRSSFELSLSDLYDGEDDQGQSVLNIPPRISRLTPSSRLSNEIFISGFVKNPLDLITFIAGEGVEAARHILHSRNPQLISAFYSFANHITSQELIIILTVRKEPGVQLLFSSREFWSQFRDWPRFFLPAIVDDIIRMIPVTDLEASVLERIPNSVLLRLLHESKGIAKPDFLKTLPKNFWKGREVLAHQEFYLNFLPTTLPLLGNLIKHSELSEDGSLPELVNSYFEPYGVILSYLISSDRVLNVSSGLSELEFGPHLHSYMFTSQLILLLVLLDDQKHPVLIDALIRNRQLVLQGLPNMTINSVYSPFLWELLHSQSIVFDHEIVARYFAQGQGNPNLLSFEDSLQALGIPGPQYYRTLRGLDRSLYRALVYVQTAGTITSNQRYLSLQESLHQNFYPHFTSTRDFNSSLESALLVNLCTRHPALLAPIIDHITTAFDRNSRIFIELNSMLYGDSYGRKVFLEYLERERSEHLGRMVQLLLWREGIGRRCLYNDESELRRVLVEPMNEVMEGESIVGRSNPVSLSFLIPSDTRISCTLILPNIISDASTQDISQSESNAFKQARINKQIDSVNMIDLKRIHYFEKNPLLLVARVREVRSEIIDDLSTCIIPEAPLNPSDSPSIRRFSVPQVSNTNDYSQAHSLLEVQDNFLSTLMKILGTVAGNPNFEIICEFSDSAVFGVGVRNDVLLHAHKLLSEDRFGVLIPSGPESFIPVPLLSPQMMIHLALLQATLIKYNLRTEWQFAPEFWEFLFYQRDDVDALIEKFYGKMMEELVEVYEYHNYDDEMFPLPLIHYGSEHLPFDLEYPERLEASPLLFTPEFIEAYTRRFHSTLKTLIEPLYTFNFTDYLSTLKSAIKSNWLRGRFEYQRHLRMFFDRDLEEFLSADFFRDLLISGMGRGIVKAEELIGALMFMEGSEGVTTNDGTSIISAPAALTLLLRELTPPELHQFLLVATGSAQPPLSGFTTPQSRIRVHCMKGRQRRRLCHGNTNFRTFSFVVADGLEETRELFRLSILGSTGLTMNDL